MKSLLTFKNPLTSQSGSVADPSVWTGGILWVVVIGLIFAMGSALSTKIDKVIPGNQTPNMKPYSAPVTGGSGLNIL